MSIDGKTCREAIEQILKPVGLTYEVQNGVLVLSRQTSVSVPGGSATSEQKLAAARTALRGPQKDAARAKNLLLDIVQKEQTGLQPGSLCYACVYLGYIEDRAGNRKEALA